MDKSGSISRHIRHNVVGYIALFCFAIGGTASALPGKNQVNSGDIKNGNVKLSDLAANAVDSTKVVDNGLTGADINESTLSLPQQNIPDALAPTGPAGGDLSGTYPNPQVSEAGLVAGGDLTGSLANAQVGEAGLVAGGDLTGSLANAQVSEAGLTAGGDLSGPLSAALLGANTLGILEPGTAADDEIADGSVDTEDVANNNLVANDLATDSVANLELANNAAADAEITDVTRTILIPASQLGQAALAEPAATNPDFSQIASSRVPVILFDPDTIEALDLTIPIPQDRVAGSDLEVELLWSGSIAAGGAAVTWLFQYLPITPGSDLVNAALVDGNVTTVNTTTANRLNRTTFGTADIPGASVANGDLLQLRISRDAIGEPDSMTVDAALFAVGISYTAAR